MSAFLQEIDRSLFHLVPPTTEQQLDEGQPVDTTNLPAVVTDDDLDRVLRDYLGVKLPNLKCCEAHSTPWAAVHDAFFARSVVAIWKASRGLGGKSFTLSALAMAEALFLRADVNILGGSGVQSKRVLEAIAGMWAHPTAPKQCLTGLPGSQVQKLVWGNRIQALMASQASVRGPHPSRLRLDEIDEMKQSILDAALGQPMSKGWVKAHVVGASTHQYPDGTMTTMLKRAAEGGWSVHEWCISASSSVATETGGRKISDLKPGDQVWAFDGRGFVLTPILLAWSNGIQSTIRVVTDRGLIECTPEHRILTKQGWRRAEDITPGNWVIVGSPLRVRRTKAATVENVPEVLPRRYGQTEHGPQGLIDAGQGNRAVRTEAVIARSQGRRIIDGAGTKVSNVLSVWAVCWRFLSSRLRRGCRSLRTTTQEVSAERRARQAPSRESGRGRPEADYFIRPGSALVVEIAPGRDTDVWDLSLPKHHAFLANGHVVHNCYKENLEPHGWLSLAEVERKRAILTAAMWNTEIELQEPSSEGRAFDTAKVDEAFRTDLAMVIRSSREEVILEEPVEGARYGTGSDWAKKKNHSVTITIRHDCTPARVVAIRREQKKPWPDMVAAAEAQAKRYGGIWVHDNTGLGQVVHDLINIDAEAFDMVGRQRAELLSEYISSVEHGEVVYPREDSLVPTMATYSEHKYATREDIYKGTKDGSGRHHLPDTISAGAFAWRACGGIMPASATRDPDPDENPYLQRGVHRGRLSGYISGLRGTIGGNEND